MSPTNNIKRTPITRAVNGIGFRHATVVEIPFNEDKITTAFEELKRLNPVLCASINKDGTVMSGYDPQKATLSFAKARAFNPAALYSDSEAEKLLPSYFEELNLSLLFTELEMKPDGISTVAVGFAAGHQLGGFGPVFQLVNSMITYLQSGLDTDREAMARPLTMNSRALTQSTPVKFPADKNVIKQGISHTLSVILRSHMGALVPIQITAQTSDLEEIARNCGVKATTNSVLLAIQMEIFQQKHPHLNTIQTSLNKEYDTGLDNHIVPITVNIDRKEIKNKSLTERLAIYLTAIEKAKTEFTTGDAHSFMDGLKSASSDGLTTFQMSQARKSLILSTAWDVKQRAASMNNALVTSRFDGFKGAFRIPGDEVSKSFKVTPWSKSIIIPTDYKHLKILTDVMAAINAEMAIKMEAHCRWEGTPLLKEGRETGPDVDALNKRIQRNYRALYLLMALISMIGLTAIVAVVCPEQGKAAISQIARLFYPTDTSTDHLKAEEVQEPEL